VKDKAIQAILRHSNLSTTMNAYAKSVSLNDAAAMRILEAIYAASGRIADNRAAVKKTWHFEKTALLEGIADAGGEGGIRTPDRGVSPYNGLANRRLQPLGHLSVKTRWEISL
jgi:hypothetical protein